MDFDYQWFQIICLKDDESLTRFICSYDSLPFQPIVVGYSKYPLTIIDTFIDEFSKTEYLKWIYSTAIKQKVSYIGIIDEDILFHTQPPYFEIAKRLTDYDIIVPRQLCDNRHWVALMKKCDQYQDTYTSSQKGAFAFGCMVIRRESFCRWTPANVSNKGYVLDDQCFHSYRSCLYMLWEIIHPFESKERSQYKKMNLKKAILT